MNMTTMMTRPIQNADMLPATKPERMFNDAPPCREQLVTSRTCRELVLTNIFVNSGITAPAKVPQLMITESTHQKSGWTAPAASLKPPSRTLLAMKVMAIETAEVIQTRCVSGASKSKSFSPPNLAWLTASLRKYETSEVTIIKLRITNSQIINVAQIAGLAASASARNAISATPVTPYVSKPSAARPTE